MWNNFVIPEYTHNCSDCMKIIKNNTSSIKLNCSHNFHYDCYFTNLLLDIKGNIDLLNDNIKSCPKCKKDQTVSFFKNFDTEGKMKKIKEDCPICLQELGYVCEIVETQCNHKYHIKCLSKWVKKKMDCPMCRLKLDLETIGKLDLLPPQVPQQLQRQNHVMIRINPDRIINSESDSDEESTSSEELERKEDDSDEEIHEFLEDTFSMNNNLLNSITINVPRIIQNNIDFNQEPERKEKEEEDEDIFNINDDIINDISINN